MINNVTFIVCKGTAFLAKYMRKSVNKSKIKKLFS